MFSALHPQPRTEACGNPRYATTFRDEGFNAQIADMARATHRTQLEPLVLTRAALLAARGGAPEKTKRRRRQV